MTDSHTRETDNPSPPPDWGRWLTVPNLLCLVRLAGAFALVGIALSNQPRIFLGVFLFVALTDWIDGKLAVWLEQQTTFGARLDSAVDAVMYAALVFGMLWLKADVLFDTRYWIPAVLLSYAASCLAALVKFRRLPSYHTWGAKTSWLIILLAVIALFSFQWVWPLQVAAVVVTLTNLEAIAITVVLGRWESDVPSLYHGLRRSSRI